MKKIFELDINIINTRNSNVIAKEHRSIIVPFDSDKDNFIRIFAYLRDQHPDLYQKYKRDINDDFDFEIEKVQPKEIQ